MGISCLECPQQNISDHFPLPNPLLFFILDGEEIIYPFTKARIMQIILDIALFLTFHIQSVTKFSWIFIKFIPFSPSSPSLIYFWPKTSLHWSIATSFKLTSPSILSLSNLCSPWLPANIKHKYINMTKSLYCLKSLYGSIFLGYILVWIFPPDLAIAHPSHLISHYLLLCFSTLAIQAPLHSAL